ncbi:MULTISPECIES: ferritin-like domain-containing protein [unclassified Undibacterium]|uniref:ferritin-like domain-containing protein n=1 Tax=unclassified Undibacterium TaxID=2630295 RepID=UPI002AC8A8D7|nr:MULTISPECIES: ferritin-like domain-containing protein [unclassified Undibacterium]MEB0138697.1 ferritin-like domain-containing protein [Undibacterium sp. CCC2.1]MEB0171498.1 ferritin-like domain-containing protein [Undibacterium sp. CCC1.1]MEB0175431.1 ferritin-like domain-containing protein [Undibacterium sp. CCC3.4]MEB0214698.1 ferritin-like domain-containing protein [Undibacterium sp. 5I2]WPX45685.1 ferritin-like domain-containing protein [Undibacterium sp. CCC3.4]
MELRAVALAALLAVDTDVKCALLAALPDEAPLDTVQCFAIPAGIPGRPLRPELIAPGKVGRRSMLTVEGRAILIHALAHIEMNAINLATDIIWRFPHLPEQFYRDWLKVAKEEARHFQLLEQHLQTLGYQYGDFPAHNSLWEMAEKTCDDLLARLALVPRTLEARGLDVTPGVSAKLAQAGDAAGAALLMVIYHDEIGHVAIGNHWYQYLCNQQGHDTIATYARLALHYAAPTLRGPFNLAARRAAGFTELELQALPQSST